MALRSVQAQLRSLPTVSYRGRPPIPWRPVRPQSLPIWSRPSRQNRAACTARKNSNRPRSRPSRTRLSLRCGFAEADFGTHAQYRPVVDVGCADNPAIWLRQIEVRFLVSVLTLAKAVVGQRRENIAVFGHTIAITTLGNSHQLFLKCTEAFDFRSDIRKLCRGDVGGLCT